MTETETTMADAPSKSEQRELDLIEARSQFDTLSVNERDEFVSFAQLRDTATVEIVNPYRVVEKDELVGVPFIVRTCQFRESPDYENGEFVILYCITEKDEMVIITDGGAGILEYMKRAVEKRIANGEASPYDGFLFPNGLRFSDYRVDPKTGKALPAGSTGGDSARTYYFA